MPALIPLINTVVNFADIRGEITNALSEKNVTGRCPLCGNLRWTLAEGIIYSTIQTSSRGLINTGTLPQVALICANCGNTHFLNLVTLGLGSHFGLMPDTAK
jgi:hypothetical protein